MEFNFGELFSGPGGLGLGAKQARLEHEQTIFSIAHRWAVDYDADSCETYRYNICPEHPDSVRCEDVRELDYNTLAPITALAFGFPCNDFSVVGEQKGFAGKFGPLYRYGVKALQQFQPLWFLAENVGGLSSANEGQAFNIILNEMLEAGYTLTAHLYKFEDYGVPQARHRLIIVGVRNDLGLTFEVPQGQRKVVTSQQALEEPPIPPNAANQVRTRQSKRVVERLRHIKPGENAWTADLPEHLRLNVKGAKLSQIYKRLEPDKPAYTVTGSGGGGTHMYHWAEPRALTNRERARLQTFPDEFVFMGGKESVRRQIGMAVPVMGVKQIVEAIFKTFAGLNYPSEPPSVGYLRRPEDIFPEAKSPKVVQKSLW